MRVQSNISCEAASELMSPFIDSMVSMDEADSLRSHLSDCKSCKRQLQSFISVRNVVAGVDPLPVPEDLQLETRIRLSHARQNNRGDQWQARFDNILKPFAMPAVMGVILTLLGFGILFGGLTAPRQVIASEDGRGCICGRCLSATQHAGSDLATAGRRQPGSRQGTLDSVRTQQGRRDRRNQDYRG